MKKNKNGEIINRSITNIIFDLGGVIIDVDYLKTQKAFEDLGVKNFDKVFSQFTQNEIADMFETGKLTPSDFRKSLRAIIPDSNIEDEKIDFAWNSMILNLPEKNLEVLDAVGKKYRIFLLSNINVLHINYCKTLFNYDLLVSKFEKVYLSYQIGCRKPDPDAYEFVLNDAKIHAAETLFIDDTLKNVDGALKMGLNAYHLRVGETISDLFCL